MTNQFLSISKRSLVASIIAIGFLSVAIAAQTSNTKCRPAVIPVDNEPPPKIIIEPALPEPLARGVAVVPYCTENLHIVPVFGAKALTATPRIGHLHVRLDDSPWVWADASGNPIIIMGLAPGPHKITLELVNANHQTLDKAEVTFTIPARSTTQTQKKTNDAVHELSLSESHHPE